ncbi:MAG TPA: YncE family protein [Acidimicrobiia bacterium]
MSTSNRAFSREIAVGKFPVGISSDGTHVWVTNGGGNPVRASVSELSASTGAVIQTIPMGNGAFYVSSDGTHVWVTSTNTVTEFSASTGAVIHTIPDGHGASGVWSDGTHVWVTNVDSTVSEFSASTGAVIRTIPVSRDPGAVSSDGIHVWVTHFRSNTVTELSASTGAIIQTIGVGNGPDAVSSDGTHVWVTNGNDDTVTEILPGVPQGDIFATTFKHCTTLHVGYNRFVNGAIVHWRVTTNGVGTVASGQFTAIGGGKLGSKTYHFLDIALGTTLPSDASGIQSHVVFTWVDGGRFDATRDPGC